MKKLMLILTIVCLFGLTAVVAAQNEVVLDATLSTDQSAVTVGDVIHFTLNVVHPAGYRVVLPDMGDTWGDFEIRTVNQPEIVQNADGSQTTHIRIDAALFRPGTFTTPQLTLTVYDTDGQAQSLAATPISMTVNSVLQAGDTTLRDIRAQAELALPQSTSLTSTLIPVAMALAIVAILLIAFFIFRRRDAPIVDLRQPYEVAFDELARIKSLTLIEQGAFIEYYGLLSQCVRRYLQTGLQIPAMEHTTPELKPILRNSALDYQQARELLNILTECDLVKFGGAFPDVESAQHIAEQITQFVEETRPRPQPALTVAEGSTA